MARRKSDSEKGPIGAWATRQRERMGWKPADVVQAMSATGQPITEGTYRGIEAGPRPPSKHIVRALERVFESEAPDPSAPSVEAADMTALVAALGAQTAAINRLVDYLGGQALPDRVTALEAVLERSGWLPAERRDEGSPEPRVDAGTTPRP